MNAIELWGKVIEAQKEGFVQLGGKRCPLTVLANTRTLNIMVTGVDDKNFPRFEKIIFKGQYGDIYFHRHFSVDDGELVFL